jgi:hypothetical protein
MPSLLYNWVMDKAIYAGVVAARQKAVTIIFLAEEN